MSFHSLQQTILRFTTSVFVGLLVFAVGFNVVPQPQLDQAGQLTFGSAVGTALAATASSTFSTATSTATWTVPAGVTSLTVKAWGGGGGSGQRDGGDSGEGGGAGFVGGTIAVTPGETLTIMVGGGGGGDGSKTGGLNGGGTGGDDTRIIGGGGGGYSAVKRSSAVLLLAAGGGGGGAEEDSGGDPGGDGGPGGGLTGTTGSKFAGSDAFGGGGGTQSAGGSGGAGGTAGAAGSSLQGGAGGNDDSGGGGGGGGYYGGGGGGGDNFSSGGGGGGGSSYATSTATATSTAAGSNMAAGNNSDTDYAASAGAGGENGNGNAGRIVLSWDTTLSLSGTLYQADGVTPITTGKTIVAAVSTSTPSRHTVTSDGSGNFSITTIATSTIGSWSTSTAAGNDDAWYGVTYNNGLFVAVGKGPDPVMTSPDGTTWTARATAGIDGDWQGVTYGAGLFVAVSDRADEIMTSPDGITWTKRTFTGSGNWRAITYGDGLFVAVADAGDRVMTSPDGISWTVRSAAGDNDSWQAVTYGDGLFVAVGDAGTRVMTSPDGITWTIRNAAGDNDDWSGIAYHGGLFVAVGYANDRVMTSSDGITWAVGTTTGFIGEWQAVTHANGLFVAVADGGDRVMTSPDGTTWTLRNAAGDNDSWEGVTYGQGKFVAVGRVGDRVMNAAAGFGEDTPITFFVDGDVVDAATLSFGVNFPGGTTTVENIDLYQNTVRLQHATSSGVIDLAKSDFYDSADDADVLFTSVSGTTTIGSIATTTNLRVASGTVVHGSQKLFVTGDTTVAGDFRGEQGLASTTDLTIAAGATFTAPQSLTVHGDYDNNGLFTEQGTLYLDSELGFSANVQSFATTTLSQNVDEDGLAFSAAGDKLYVIDSGSVAMLQYDLSTAFDITTATFAASTSISTYSPSPSEFLLSVDGADALVTNWSAKEITQYEMTTPWDITSLTYVATTSLRIETEPAAINADGTRLFTRNGASIDEYVLSTGWDVTTLSFVEQHAAPFAPFLMAFSSDEESLFLAASDELYEYSLPGPLDLSHLTFVQSGELGFDELNVYAGAFTGNGRQFVTGAYSSANYFITDVLGELKLRGDLVGGSALGDVVLQGAARTTAVASTTDLTIAAAGTLRLTDDIDISGNLTNNGGFASGMGTTTLSGTGAIVTGAFTGTNALGSLAIRGSVAASTTLEVTDLIVASGATFTAPSTTLTMRGDLTNNGTFAANGGTVRFANQQYDLADSTSLSTGGSFGISGSFVDAFVFNASGTRVIFINQPNDSVYQYALSVPWDITTLATTSAGSKNVGAQAPAANGLAFNPAGTKMFVLDSNTDKVYSYTLSTAFDVTTATYSTNSLTVADTTAADMRFVNDGAVLLVTGHQNDSVISYNLATPYDLTTATAADTLSVSAQMLDPLILFMSPDGARLVVGDAAGNYQYYGLTTPYDISTGYFIESAVGPAGDAVAFGETGSDLYVVDTSRILQYRLPSLTQTIAGSFTGSSAFADLEKRNEAQLAFTGNASTTGRFSATSTFGAALVFAASSSHTFEDIELTGASAVYEIALRSSASGTPWYIDVPGSQLSVQFVDVQDSTASTTITANLSTDSGNNTNWIFTDPFWNASDWTLYDTITIDAANIDDDLTSFPVYVDLADLSSQFWSTTPAAAALVGTDIRVTTDAGSPVELPRELVAASSTAETGELYFKADSISSTTDTVFRIYYNGATDGDYGVSDTYGAENVWNSYNVVWHMNSLTQADSAGNLPDRSIVGDFTDPSLSAAGNVTMDNNDTMRVAGDLGSFTQWSSMLYWNESGSVTAGRNHTDNAGFTNMYVANIGSDDNQVDVRSGSGGIQTIGGAVATSGDQVLVVTYANSVISIYSNGSLVATTTGANPTSNWNGWNIYRITSGKLYESRGAPTAFSAAYVAAQYLNFATTTDFYEVAAAAGVTGSTTLSNHVDTQVGNAFSFQNKTNESLFAFQLTPNSGTATVTNMVFSLLGVQTIAASDFSNLRLYRDLDADAAYDASDTQVGGAGVMDVSGQVGTITFSGDFTATTSQNYILVADWNAPSGGGSFTVTLPLTGITAIDDNGAVVVLGAVNTVQHIRNTASGGGGSAAAIAAPVVPGDGDVFGGTNEGGELIGNDPDFKLPTANSGSWTNGQNAYDEVDGTYATDNTGTTNNFTDHSFVVAGGNTIEGIIVKLEVSGTTAAGDIGVQLSWDGGTSWTTTKTTPTLTTTDAVVTLGAASDLWGRTWTPAEFSNANFALRLTGNPSSNSVQVDALQVRVYHQSGGGGGGGGGAI